jgi:hypothetical protein
MAPCANWQVFAPFAPQLDRMTSFGHAEHPIRTCATDCRWAWTLVLIALMFVVIYAVGTLVTGAKEIYQLDANCNVDGALGQ